MDRKQLYFGFEGRIGRAELWLGLAAVGLVFFIVNVLVLIGLSAFGRSVGIDDETIGREAYLIMTLIWLAALYPCAALLAKRLADRERPRWLAAIGLLPSAAWYGALMAGALSGRTPTLPLWWLLVAAAIGAWLVVDLGLMRGRGEAGPFALPRHAEG